MKCVVCPHRIMLNFCTRLKQLLDDGKTQVQACNWDGKVDWVDDVKET